MVDKKEVLDLAKKLLVYGMMKRQGDYQWVDKKICIQYSGAGPFDNRFGINIRLQRNRDDGSNDIVFWSIEEEGEYVVYLYRPGKWTEYLKNLAETLCNEMNSPVEDSVFFDEL